MTTRRAHSGELRSAEHGGDDQGPDPAVARWENEGGTPASRPRRGADGTSTRVGQRGNRPADAVTAEPGAGQRREPRPPRQSRVRVGRVYDARTAEDGTRVLVDRLWPRAVSKHRADLDEWCKQVAPSRDLRRWYSHDPDRFVEFARRYRRELEEPERAEALQHLRESARQQPLTLLTATRRTDISGAAVLAEVLAHETGEG